MKLRLTILFPPQPLPLSAAERVGHDLHIICRSHFKGLYLDNGLSLLRSASPA